MSSTKDDQKSGMYRNPTRKIIRDPELILNGYEMFPHYISGGIGTTKGGASGALGYNAYRFQENVKPVPYGITCPHTHSCHEYFIFFGTNPDNPDDIGGTTEFWIGGGEDAEPYIITRPTIVDLPPHTYHLPQVSRGYRRPSIGIVVHDAALWSIGRELFQLNPAFNINKLAKTEKFSKKYEKYIYTRDIAMAPYYPAHKGKEQVLLHHDMRHNELTTHTFQVSLISGAGIGWGCGDAMQFSSPQKYEIRSLPHLHDALEIFGFYGTDPENPQDLGGTVEFWMGEGPKAKKFTINRTTMLCVPPNTVHLPMWVSEVRRPFILMSILDSPVETKTYIENFPPAFKNVATPEIPQMKLELVYYIKKCTYPKCHICVDQCPVDGIDLSVEPRRVAEPCLSCGGCALFCPTGAIKVKGLKKA